MFKTIDEVTELFRGQNYIVGPEISTVVYLACRMEKPLLVEGPAGVGKTDLAKVLAASLGLELIRLQCYEGLDEAKALYEWEYAKQLLYTQLLGEKISEILSGAAGLSEAVEKISSQEDVFFSDRFLLPRPLLKAIRLDSPCVLLIDEVDKSDAEFEAFLLEVLSDFQVSVPEIGTIKAKHKPYVILTSNNTREMSDALKRRCLHLYMDFPSKEQELDIVRLKTPGIEAALTAELVELIRRLRELDLKKVPSVSETLDWARGLVILNADRLDEKLVNDTLGLILKHESDIVKARVEADKFFASRQKPSPVNQGTGPAGKKTIH